MRENHGSENVAPILSPKTQAILADVSDAELRHNVEITVSLALHALAALRRIHLPQDHIEEGTPGALSDHKHLELAPYVLAALANINRLLEHLVAVFPAPADTSGGEQSDDDFDLEFDLVDGPTGESARLSAKPVVAAHKSEREQVLEAAYAFGGMLRSRVLAFAPRLRHALGQDDAWALLGELDHYQHALSKSVQGLLFGILAIFTDDVRREEILPEYRSGVREAVDLRAALCDLGYHVSRFNAAIASAQPAQLVPLVVAVADRLARFCGRPEYRTLRAEDKREVIDFRRSLYEMRHRKEGVPVARLRQEIEGFSKFLEAMQAINHREVLVVHDRQRLSECADRLGEANDRVRADPEAAKRLLATAVSQLASVMGRHPDLDDALRRSEGGLPQAAELANELARWLNLVQRALSTVG